MKRCLVALLATLIPVAKADFNDFVDPTYNCPARTTCPVICVSSVQNCPTKCEFGEQVCADGSCAVVCDESLESACEEDCANVACPKVDDFYNICQEKFGSYYEAVERCIEDEKADLHLLNFNETPYVFGYTWVSVLTTAMLLWCAWNQRFRPEPAVMVSLEKSDADRDTKEEAPLKQIGYKEDPVGLTLYVLTLLTFFGWIALLAWGTMQYYILDDVPYMSRRKAHFVDEEQLLKTYIIVWSVAFVWCFALKWPYSIRSLFRRRCPLSQATVVAIFQERPTNQDAYSENKGKKAVLGLQCLQNGFSRAFREFNSCMAWILSDIDCFHCRNDGSFAFCRVHKLSNGKRYLVFQLQRCNYEEGKGFVLAVYSVGSTLGDILNGLEGLSAAAVDERLKKVGPNAFDMTKPYFLVVLGQEVTKPFYTYQLFMIWSWFPIYYYYMAMVWSGVITTSAVVVAWFHYHNLDNLYRLTRIRGSANVLRDGSWRRLNQKNLVPGDVVKVETGLIYCDMILAGGGTCLVDESALTGESYPHAKVPIDPVDASNKIDKRTHKRHILTAGTTVLETNDSIGVVYRTGSSTTKGELLRQIVGYRRHQFKFDTEVVMVIGILALYAVFQFNMTVYLIEDTTVYGWFYGMYVVGTVLPPLLPTVFTVSVGVSDSRLAAKRIATANSESILIAGKVTRAFFDKTGTLTRQGLDFARSRPVEDWDSTDDTKTIPKSDRMRMAMAVCHSLTQASDGSLIGNPVDQAMFTACEAKFISTEKDTTTVIMDGKGSSYKVVRHFDFDHQRMTQSVVVQLDDGSGGLVAVVKGSGESIEKICNPKTLPGDFAQQLEASARAGIYQISVASKPLRHDGPVGTITRDQVEFDLEFVGVLDFQNLLREETPGVIQHLAEGEIVSTMLTGDSVQTGIRVAYEAGIFQRGKEVVVGSASSSTSGEVSWANEHGEDTLAPSKVQLEAGDVQVALTGNAWNLLLTTRPKEAIELAPHVRVFGRCTPQEKVSIVQTIVDLGYVTLMCGDGGNDTGALKAAHVGVALSDAEASMVAPFASLDKTLSSVVDVLKEGRCALASALATYKYMIMYGQVETINQVINAYFQVTFTEWCWVFMDGIWTITMAFTLPLAKPAHRLSNTRPTASILGLQTFSSAVGVLALNFIFTVISLIVLFQQNWYKCRKWDDNDVSNVTVIGDNYEAQTLFLVTGYQYIASAIAYNFGYEFRQAWWRNYLFVLASVVFTFLHFYATLVPGYLSCLWRVNCDNDHVVNSVTTREKVPILNPFNTTVMPEDYRVKILVIMIANLIAIVAWDYLVVNGLRLRWARKERARREEERAMLTERRPIKEEDSSNPEFKA